MPLAYSPGRGAAFPGQLLSMLTCQSHECYRGSGAGTLGVPLGGTRRVGGLLGVAGRLSGTVSLLWPPWAYRRLTLGSRTILAATALNLAQSRPYGSLKQWNKNKETVECNG